MINDTETQTALRSFEEDFQEQCARDGSEPVLLQSLRQTAFAHFKGAGFPTNKQEEWRFTNVAPIARTVFVVHDSGIAGEQIQDVSRWQVAGEKAVTMVFFNGVWLEHLSTFDGLPPGVQILPLSRAIASGAPGLFEKIGRITDTESNAFSALNTSLFKDGVLVSVADGVVFERPIQVLMLSRADETPRATFPRILVMAGRNSSVSIVEVYGGDGDGPGLTNAITEVYLGEGAHVEHDKLQQESLSHYHIATMVVRQERDSVFTSNAITLGGMLVRNGVYVTLAGPGADCTLNGLAVGAGTQHLDNHTSIDHAVEKCTSHELYKTILDGSSRGVFNGKIFVRPDAQKTDAKQTNKTVLLSDNAVMNTKPQLEIFADDVKCTHGATIGQLDEEQLFYLRARGIDREAARDMLTLAFANDVVTRIHVDALKNQLDQLLRSRLQGGRRQE